MASNKITPPTNLWGPTTTPTSSQIPDNVILASDNSSFASGASGFTTNSLQKEQTQQQHAPTCLLSHLFFCTSYGYLILYICLYLDGAGEYQ